MNRRKKVGRRLTPVRAVLLLAACGGVAWFSLGSHFGGAGQPAADDFVAFADPEPEGSGSQEGGGEVSVGRDLLAEHGSWTTTTPVRMAFASATEVAGQAAPAGETDAGSRARWVGADPPVLQVGVVMVGEAVRRAVVAGRVVGLGDSIDRVTIVGIERDAVIVTWGGRRLTYDLENGHPREFRGELQRRDAARATTQASDSKQKQDSQ